MNRCSPALTMRFLVLHGAMKDFESFRKIIAEVPKLMKRKNNQLEIYVVRKVRCGINKTVEGLHS